MEELFLKNILPPQCFGGSDPTLLISALESSKHFLSVYFFRYILVPLRWTRRTWSSDFWRRQRHPFHIPQKLHSVGSLHRITPSDHRSSTLTRSRTTRSHLRCHFGFVTLWTCRADWNDLDCVFLLDDFWCDFFFWTLWTRAVFFLPCVFWPAPPNRVHMPSFRHTCRILPGIHLNPSDFGS